MGWIGLLLLSLCAQAEDLEHKLSWAISVDGKRIGQRDVTVKYVPGEVGQRRILESWTEVDGTAGSMRLVYRQRMTAHAADREPASFHSVMEQNGVPVEVQARWTPSAWWVTTNTGGRQRTVDVPVMSGYGGNHVMMLPSGLSVVRFMDAGDYEVSHATLAAEMYRSSCR